MSFHDTYLKIDGVASWFVLAMALACMWAPFVFAAFAIGRRQVTIRFWLLLLFAEGAALLVFKLIVLDLTLTFSGTAGPTSRYGAPSPPNATSHTTSPPEKAP